MTVPVHFDEKAVAAALDRAVDSLRWYAQEPGSVGAQARVRIAAMKAVQLAVLAEYNRGSDTEDVIDAVCSLACETIMTVAMAHFDSPDWRMADAADVREFERRCKFAIVRLREMIGQHLSGEALSTTTAQSVRGLTGGRA